MSTPAQVCVIRDVQPHSNADRLDVATVLGWQMVVAKNTFKTGDLVVYFQIGTALPQTTAAAMGVENYLSARVNAGGARELVVRQVRLRGQPSFGLIHAIPAAHQPDGADPWSEGDDVSHLFGATKFVPPLREQVVDAAPEVPNFAKYDSLEQAQNQPDLLAGLGDVQVSEKIEGTNCRVGLVLNEDGREEWMAGSRTVRRTDPGVDHWAQNMYWRPLADQRVQLLIRWIWNNQDDAKPHSARSVILYGEVYGPGVQGCTYGRAERGFAVFDIAVNGVYLHPATVVGYCEAMGVEHVPVLYTGPADLAVLRSLTTGLSCVPGAAAVGQEREGIVIRSVSGNRDPRIGREILKWVGDEYLLSEAAQLATTDV